MSRTHKAAPAEDELYAPIQWREEGEYGDILYERAEAIAKITINRSGSSSNSMKS